VSGNETFDALAMLQVLVVFRSSLVSALSTIVSCYQKEFQGTSHLTHWVIQVVGTLGFDELYCSKSSKGVDSNFPSHGESITK